MPLQFNIFLPGDADKPVPAYVTCYLQPTATVSFESIDVDLPADPKLVQSRRMRNLEKKRQQERLQEQRAKSLDRNHTRVWKSGDVYSPHDLSPSEMKKWRKRSSPSSDAFDVLGLNPLHQYKVWSAPGFIFFPFPFSVIIKGLIIWTFMDAYLQIAEYFWHENRILRLCPST